MLISIMLIFGNKKCTLKLHGLIFGEGGGLFAGILGFCLFTRVCGMSENMEGPKNNILTLVFLIGATMVGAIGKFWILAFIEALKTKFNDF